MEKKYKCYLQKNRTVLIYMIAVCESKLTNILDLV
jgi:hypothetical protein